MIAGVDIGGTFTDIVIQDDGDLTIHKVLSTPQDPSQAMMAGLQHITATLEKLTAVVHGSTVATNAILERKGARIALITTRGFADILHIGRQQRPQLYALYPSLPPPLISPERIFEALERLDHNGEVLTELTPTALDALAQAVAQARVDAVAVCLLYSYRNPRHEHAIRDHILAKTDLEAWQIALSSDVLPEFREYERATTTALEAYVRPVMTRYVSRLRDQLPATTSLRIMRSDGGIMSADNVAYRAVQTALSGPAAGIIGAHYLAKIAGFDDVITLDMGGTSTDVALIKGEPGFSHHAMMDGLPLRHRLLDIETIGAGGGSIVRLDSGGALRVGPDSAGADPGAIVYGRGGDQLTVTDANALLGRIPPDAFLGGQMPLDLKVAREVADKIARQAHLTPDDIAHGVIDIANANIERALRRVSVARGYDPRDFVMVAFGGAGPLHACQIAERLDMQQVLIPRHPGVLCAFGLLCADVRLEFSMPVMKIVSSSTVPFVRAKQGNLLAAVHQELKRQNIDPADMTYTIFLDLRYLGQAYEIPIPFFKTLAQDFHNAHQAAYGHAMPDHPIEMVTMRIQARVPVDKPTLQPHPPTDQRLEDAILRQHTTPTNEKITYYDRDRLGVGMRFQGGAIVTQLDSTLYVPPDWHATVDAYHNIILQHQPES